MHQQTLTQKANDKIDSEHEFKSYAITANPETDKKAPMGKRLTDFGRNKTPS